METEACDGIDYDINDGSDRHDGGDDLYECEAEAGLTYTNGKSAYGAQIRFFDETARPDGKQDDTSVGTGVGTMKSDRMSRKSTLSKQANRPDGDIIVYAGADEMICEDDLGPWDLSLYSAYDSAESIEPKKTMPAHHENFDSLMEDIMSTIKQSPAILALLSHAAQNDWAVAVMDLHNGGYHMDVDHKILFLGYFSLTPSALGRSEYFCHALTGNLVRGLRDIWHEGRNRPFEQDFGPEQVLMMERVRAADCDTIAILAAWELRGAGFPGLWRHMIGSPEGDMALVFSRVLERDPSAFMNGTALAYTFRQWYADENRVDGCDHETLEILDDLLLSSNDHRPFGHKMLRDAHIESMAMMADGVCYLAGVGETIRTDPFFAGLRDEINQSHLFQIIYDTEVTMTCNVPFRDRALAAKIFPPTHPVA
jgi:hypothetical protein